jgi:hypothetical protein
MQIDHNKKLIFVQIPKNASSSICNYFGGPNQFVYDKKWTEYQIHFQEYWNDYTKFAVVRNPIDKFISAYKFIRSGNYDILQINNDLTLNSDINEFLNFVENNLENIVTPILKPQHYFICDDNDIIMVDKVIRYENLEVELESIGITGLEILNQSTIEDENLIVLSQDSIDKLNILYQKDFEIFSYQ